MGSKAILVLPFCTEANYILFVFYVFFVTSSKTWQKGKAIPLQAWTGPEGSRRLKLPDFKTIGTGKW
jgi:hypothetical protein